MQAALATDANVLFTKVNRLRLSGKSGRAISLEQLCSNEPRLGFDDQM
jgi:hypothetical protein